MRMLDLFSGRWGWSRAFAARGWHCVGIDLVEPSEIPANCTFVKLDILKLRYLTQPIRHFNIVGSDPNPLWEWCNFDFICASSPCEQFSVHGMRHFHKDPPFPTLGVKLFQHTEELCEESGIPYVMENVRAAQQFVGRSIHHCGAFHLWGKAVPPLLPRNIWKGWEHKYIDSKGRKRGGGPGRYEWSTSEGRREAQAKVATIPPELANCVAEYAERICEVKRKNAHRQPNTEEPGFAFSPERDLR